MLLLSIVFFHTNIFSENVSCSGSLVFVESGPSKCMSPAGTVAHLPYPPTGAYDIENRSQDLDYSQMSITVPAMRGKVPSTNICNRVSLPKGDMLFRYLRTRPSPDNIRVRTRAASAKLASKVHDISIE